MTCHRSLSGRCPSSHACQTAGECFYAATPTPEEPQMPLDLAAIRARLDAATPAPWHLSADREKITQTSHVTRDVWTIPRTHADMELIAHAPTDLRALLDEVERLRGDCDELQRAAERAAAAENANAADLATVKAERDRLVSLCHAAATDIETCGGDAHDSSSLLRRLHGEQGGGYISETLRAAIAQLRAKHKEAAAAFANERGEGEPPSEGWSRNDFDAEHVGVAWYRSEDRGEDEVPAHGAAVLWVYREHGDPEWTWEVERYDAHGDDYSHEATGKASTARDGMRAADRAQGRE